MTSGHLLQELKGAPDSAIAAAAAAGSAKVHACACIPFIAVEQPFQHHSMPYNADCSDMTTEGEIKSSGTVKQETNAPGDHLRAEQARRGAKRGCGRTSAGTHRRPAKAAAGADLIGRSIIVSSLVQDEKPLCV